MIIEEVFLKASFLTNPILNPMLKQKNILKNEILKKAAQEGIYYITTEKQANKIIEESLINSPEPFYSYGLKKPVFYAGIPSFSVSCNDLKLPKTLIAVKINIPYETLALFQMEMFQNAYKLFYPNLFVEPFELKRVYLGLTVIENKFCYQELTNEEYENYKIQIPKTKIKPIEKELAKPLKNYLTILKKERRNLLKYNVPNL